MRIGALESTPRARQADSQSGYPAGSIVLCQNCLKPLYVLERGIGAGERGGRGADALRPFQVKDFDRLSNALDAGVAAAMLNWTPQAREEHCRKIPVPKTGDPMLCPCCGHSYPRVRAATAGEVIDQAYVIELVTIPPGRALSGKEARAWARS